MNKLSLFLGIAALAFGAAGAQAQNDITLGMVVGTSGAFAGGEAPLVNGVKLAVEDINAKGGVGGKKLKLVIEDTGSEQTGAVNAYNRMLAQKPVAIMNTTVSGFVLSQLGAIEDEGVPTFTGAASAQLALDRKGVANLFRIRTSDSLVPAAAVKFAVNTLGAKRVGVLRVNNEYGSGWRAAIEATLTSMGTKPAAVESFESADRDVTPQLLRIKEANVDALIVAGDPPNQVVAVQQIRQLGLGMKVIMSNGGVLPSTLRLYQPGAADGFYGTVDSVPARDPAQKDWAERYRKMFNIDGDYSAAEYYDGVSMLADAIAKVGADPKAVAKALREVKDRAGVGNVYTYANKGDGGQSVAIVEIKGGQLELAASVK
ncbi:ABC transporter substrate-binding protein [Terrarubrum flagellatum]|uniref:ABC transporter substrate-binding protein n=1 Tax=Terrirubrum flagellatum TaxID=2895980 RepID=UPI003144E0A2